MTVADLIAIIIAFAGLVSAFSLLYAKFIKPVKNVIKQVDDNAAGIKSLEEKISRIKAERTDDDTFSVEVRAILFESLIAILDGLEQGGANHAVTDMKKKLIKFMSLQVGSKKKK